MILFDLVYKGSQQSLATPITPIFIFREVLILSLTKIDYSLVLSDKTTTTYVK